ncbi:MAG: hypothetical protein ABEI97_03770 [Candidatus Nanohaloarchaea archaeon]
MSLYGKIRDWYQNRKESRDIYRAGVHFGRAPFVEDGINYEKMLAETHGKVHIDTTRYNPEGREENFDKDVDSPRAIDFFRAIMEDDSSSLRRVIVEKQVTQERNSIEYRFGDRNRWMMSGTLGVDVDDDEIRPFMEQYGFDAADMDGWNDYFDDIDGTFDEYFPQEGGETHNVSLDTLEELVLEGQVTEVTYAEKEYPDVENPEKLVLEEFVSGDLMDVDPANITVRRTAAGGKTFYDVDVYSQSQSGSASPELSLGVLVDEANSLSDIRFSEDAPSVETAEDSEKTAESE